MTTSQEKMDKKKITKICEYAPENVKILWCDYLAKSTSLPRNKQFNINQTIKQEKLSGHLRLHARIEQSGLESEKILHVKDLLDQFSKKIVEQLRRQKSKSEYSAASSANWTQFQDVVDLVGIWNITSDVNYPPNSELINNIANNIRTGLSKATENFISIPGEVLVSLGISIHFIELLKTYTNFMWNDRKQSYKSNRYKLVGKDDLSVIEKLSHRKRIPIEVKTISSMDNDQRKTKITQIIGPMDSLLAELDFFGIKEGYVLLSNGSVWQV
nr:173_t:CDS:2 [Entrophospora candida]